MDKKKVSIFWFRRDLRLTDNVGLSHALNSGLPVLPVFIFDENILKVLTNKLDARVSFIYHTLKEIDETLQKNGSSLYIVYRTPLNAFKNICEEFNVAQVYTNHDYEPYAINRDKEVFDYLEARHISFHSYKDQVIFEKAEVMKTDGTPYTIFTPYSVIWKNKFENIRQSITPNETKWNNFLKTKPFPTPHLKDIGFEKSGISIPPIMLDENIILNYDKTRNIPSIKGTSGLSVHLRFGTVSVRQLVLSAKKLNEQWLNELIWREFFMMILFHFPRVVTKSFKPKYDHIVWRNDPKEFELWCRGETGYPIVDAGMRELNQTGLMHNRVRMIVASFLTKHLLIDWRLGEAYFAEKLLDYELSSNNGNWQWAAGCGCDAAPYFRIFNPSEQTKRFDKEQLYVKKWLGNINEYDIMPIVEHSFARNRALATFKKYLG